MAETPRYALPLSDAEIDRYRFMAQRARAEEAEQWETAGITAGARVADVGCGPGLVTIELAEIVGDAGRAVGIDREVTAVETARALLRERGFDSVEVRVGDACETGLQQRGFDVVTLRHVLAHNSAEDQARILQHAYALLAPGGSVYLVDSDITGMRLDPHDADLIDLDDRYAAYLRAVGRDPQCGPALGSLVLAAGFDLVERGGALMTLPPTTASLRPPAWAARAAMVAGGYATDEDVARWDSAITRFGKGIADGSLRTVRSALLGHRAKAVDAGRGAREQRVALVVRAIASDLL